MLGIKLLGYDFFVTTNYWHSGVSWSSHSYHMQDSEYK